MTLEPNLLLLKQTSYNFKQITFGFRFHKETRLLIILIMSAIIMIIQWDQSSGKNNPKFPHNGLGKRDAKSPLTKASPQAKT